MSTPDQPNQSGSNPYNPGGQPNYGSGAPSNPYGAPGSGGQQGYPGGGYQAGGYQGGQSGNPPGGYPGQPGYSGQPAYQASPGAYPGYGNYPGGAELPKEPARPITVVAAFWCWIAAAVVGLIGLILTLTSPIWDLAVAAGARQSANLTAVDVQGLVNGLKIFIVVIAVIFVAVYLFFAWKMYAGRNWSRIVLTVFGALTLLSAFTPTSRTVTVNGDIYNVTTGAWAGWVQGLLALVGIVLMYLPLSNAYFKESKAFRLANRNR